MGRGTVALDFPNEHPQRVAICVGNLPYTIDDASLRDNFSEFGGVLSAKVMMDRDTRN